MRKSRTIGLQGRFGAGKSRMAGLTAINRPVHFVDIDNKLASSAWAEPGLASGDITVWELKEPMSDTNIASRLRALSADITKAKPSSQPQGIINFAEYVYKMPKDPVAMAAGTWVFDSWTMLNEHAKATIMFWSERSKFTFDQWTSLKTWHMETLSCVRDIARECGKDLILTVHERYKEEPGEKTKGVEYVTDQRGNPIRSVIGQQDIKIWASIDGAFGELIGNQLDEFYHLYVDVDSNDKPIWRCRVHPDGIRNLRTSFSLTESVFEPDFRKIWR